MTCKKLIEILSQCPPDKEVFLYCTWEGQRPIENVKVAEIVVLEMNEIELGNLVG